MRTPARGCRGRPSPPHLPRRLRRALQQGHLLLRPLPAPGPALAVPPALTQRPVQRVQLLLGRKTWGLLGTRLGGARGRACRCWSGGLGCGRGGQGPGVQDPERLRLGALCWPGWPQDAAGLRPPGMSRGVPQALRACRAQARARSPQLQPLRSTTCAPARHVPPPWAQQPASQDTAPCPTGTRHPRLKQRGPSSPRTHSPTPDHPWPCCFSLPQPWSMTRAPVALPFLSPGVLHGVARPHAPVCVSNCAVSSS